MTTLEITGQLIGGPDDGNMVTASVTEIPIRNTTELMLDGENGDITAIVTYGKYVWNGSYFEWKLGTSEVNVIKLINS